MPESIINLVDVIANNKLYLVSFSAFVGALLFPLIKWISTSTWKGIVKLTLTFNREKRFLRDYIRWVIQTNKYISVLPSNLAAVEAGTLHMVELDEIYIKLILLCGVDAGKSASLSNVLQSSKNIIILGDPGAGKSTMMKYIALHTAYLFTSQKSKQVLNVQKRIPILILLNKFHDVTKWSTEKTLLSAIKTELEHNFEHTIPERLIEKKLTDGKILLLLDAFDELASVDARQLLAERVKNFTASYPKNQFIVTSRITGYTNQLATANFEHPYTIRPLTTEHAHNFIYKWYENLSRLQAGDKSADELAFVGKQYRQKAETLITVISENERICQLAINPMILSLITLVHYVKVRLPDQRHLLYRECVDILIEQWQAIKNVKFPLFDQVSTTEKKRILQQIAWYMQEKRLKSVPRGELIDNVLRKACPEPIPENQLPDFLNVMEDRTGLLVEKGFNEQGVTEVAFSHLTFQEYLASLELFAIHEQERIVFDQLLMFVEVDTEWWQEVALLALCQFKKPAEYQQKLYQILFSKP